MTDLKENLNPASFSMSVEKDEIPEPLKPSQGVYLEKVLLPKNKSKPNPSPAEDIEKFEENPNEPEEELGKDDQLMTVQSVQKKIDFTNVVLHHKVDKLPMKKDNFSSLLVEYSEATKPVLREVKCVETSEGKLNQPFLMKFISRNMERKAQEEMTYLRVQMLQKMITKYHEPVMRSYFWKMRLKNKLFPFVKRRFELMMEDTYKKYYERWKEANKRGKMSKGIRADMPNSSIQFNKSSSIHGKALQTLSLKFTESLRGMKTVREDYNDSPCKLGIQMQGGLLDSIGKAFDNYAKKLKGVREDNNSSACEFKPQLAKKEIAILSMKYQSHMSHLKPIKEDNRSRCMSMPVQLSSSTFTALLHKYQTYLTKLKAVREDTPSLHLTQTQTKQPNQFQSNCLKDICSFYCQFKRKSITLIPDNPSIQCRPYSFNPKALKDLSQMHHTFFQQYKISNPTKNPYMLVDKPDNIDLFYGIDLNEKDVSSVIQQYYQKNSQHIFRPMSIPLPIKPKALPSTQYRIINRLKAQLIIDKPIYRKYFLDRESDRINSPLFAQPIEEKAKVTTIKALSRLYTQKYSKSMKDDCLKGGKHIMPALVFPHRISHIEDYYQSNYVKTVQGDKTAPSTVLYKRTKTIEKITNLYNSKFTKVLNEDNLNQNIIDPKSLFKGKIMSKITDQYACKYVKAISQDINTIALKQSKNVEALSIVQLTTSFLRDNPLPVLKTITCDWRSKRIQLGDKTEKEDKKTSLHLIHQKYYELYPKPKLRIVSHDKSTNSHLRIERSYLLLCEIYHKCNNLYQSKYLKTVIEDMQDSFLPGTRNQASIKKHSIIKNHYELYYKPKFEHTIVKDTPSQPMQINFSTQIQSIALIETSRQLLLKVNTFVPDWPSNRLMPPQRSRAIHQFDFYVASKRKEAKLQLRAFSNRFTSSFNLAYDNQLQAPIAILNEIRSMALFSKSNEGRINDSDYTKLCYPIEFIEIRAAPVFDGDYLETVRQNIEKEGEMEEEEHSVESAEQEEEKEGNRNVLLRLLSRLSEGRKIIIHMTNRNNSSIAIRAKHLKQIIQLSKESNTNLILFQRYIQKEEVIQDKPKPIETCKDKEKEKLLKKIMQSSLQKSTDIKRRILRQSFETIRMNTLLLTKTLNPVIDYLINSDISLNETDKELLPNQIEEIQSIRSKLLLNSKNPALNHSHDLSQAVELTFDWLLTINGSIGFKTDDDLERLINYYLHSTQSLGKIKMNHLTESQINESQVLNLKKSTRHKSPINKHSYYSTWAEPNDNEEKEYQLSVSITRKKNEIRRINGDIKRIHQELDDLEVPLQRKDSSDKLILCLFAIIVILVVYVGKSIVKP